MTLIGYLGNRRDPNKLKHAYAFAAIAKAEGMDFIYFSPGRIDTDTETVLGWTYNNGWTERTERFPDAVYNMALKNERHWSKVQFMRRKVPFTSHPIGDKISVYQRLKRGNKFVVNLIPSKELIRVREDLSEYLDTYGRVVVKPLWGAKGMGVVQLERGSVGRVKVLENKVATLYSFDDCVQWIESLNREQPQLVQQFVKCETPDGEPFDVRVHVQKDGNGRWVCSSLYQRVACPGNVTSNLSAGGYSGYLDVFLKRQYGHEWYDMKCYLRQFGVQLAEHMEEVYHESFDELGIDVGVDDMKKAMIYEVNWKPGPPPIWLLELDVARYSVLYTAYLAREKE